MSIQPNMQRLMEEVRDGKLDFALTKPEDSQVLVSVRDVRIWRIVDIVAGAAVLAYGVAGLDAGVGAVDSLLFVALLAVGALMIYCFWLLISTLAFWIVNVWEIAELFEGVYQTGRFPITIYPVWLRFGVTFLVPIAFAITVPAEAVTSRLDWGTVCARARIRRGALRLHAPLVALRAPVLLRRLRLAFSAARRTCRTPRAGRCRSRRPCSRRGAPRASAGAGSRSRPPPGEPRPERRRR